MNKKVVNVTLEQADLISSVLGQMSDGYWENCSRYEPYWKNIDVDVNGANPSVILDMEGIMRDGCWYTSVCKTRREDFTSDEGIKKWFAKKAETIFKMDLKDSFGTTRLKGHEDEPANYLDSWANQDINQTFGEIKMTINSLKH